MAAATRGTRKQTGARKTSTKRMHKDPDKVKAGHLGGRATAKKRMSTKSAASSRKTSQKRNTISRKRASS